MKKSVIAALAVALVGFVSTVRADDSPVGTWKFMQPGRGGNSREVTLKLKLDGEKLTGTVTSGQNNDMETEITDGKFKNGEVSFSVVREFNGNKRTTKYTGKLDKDTIKGKMNRETQDGNQDSDWEAKREKK